MVYKATNITGGPHPVLFLMWVCLKIGYIPNYSHLTGIMILTIGFRGTLFSDTPMWFWSPKFTGCSVPNLPCYSNLGWPPRHPVAHQPMLTLRVELREKQILGTHWALVCPTKNWETDWKPTLFWGKRMPSQWCLRASSLMFFGSWWF